MKPPISVIIVHWNNSSLLKRELGKIGNSKSVQVIVVDNASQNKPLWIKKTFPQVTLVQNKENLGYTKACNKGAQKALGEWLLFLNDDVEIREETILEMVKYCQDNKLAVASAHSSTKGYEKPLPTTLSLLSEFTPLGKFVKPPKASTKTLFGGCLLIKKSVFEKVGGWDEDFYFWFEDADLTSRLIQNQFKIGWIPLNVKHLGGVSAHKLTKKEQHRLFFNSMSIYAKKHFSLLGRVIVTLLKFRYT